MMSRLFIDVHLWFHLVVSKFREIKAALRMVYIQALTFPEVFVKTSSLFGWLSMSSDDFDRSGDL